MRSAFIFFFIISNILLKANNNSFYSDTVFNQTDKQGLKQGFWKVKYPNGAIKYTAFYKDNNPVGVMKRYFDDNSLMAELEFSPISPRIRAKLYFQGGPLAAEGIYSKKDIKDSTWNYYSFYTKNIKSRESYVNGKKNGISYGYFGNGNVAEERGWKNGVSHGVWRQYYESGVIKFSTSFVDGKREGEFVINYPDNKVELKGLYKNDKREGNWVHYNVDGQQDSVTEYKDGVASNADELHAKEQKMLEDIESKKGKIPEPDETNFIPGSK
jgi:antitoxin component YwqK of YwqJK toxin-antitoxin module